MIELHQNGGSDFMKEQYQSRRLEFFQELISLLAASRFSSPQQQVFPLITALIQENYPRRKPSFARLNKANSLEKVSSLYQKAVAQ